MKRVSIPAGFSDALRQDEPEAILPEGDLFQSLLGFLMRCDHRDGSMVRHVYLVSIPAGFSDALRLGYHETSPSNSNGFNPCWVF